MPELPEVETICRGLRGLATGRRIIEVKVFEPRLRARVGKDFGAKLQGKTITEIRRQGKYILILLEDEHV